MQKLLLITLLALFSLSGCQDNAKDIQQVQQEKAKLLEELKNKNIALQEARLDAKESKEKLLVQEQARKEAFIQEQAEKAKHNKLSKIGISVHNSKISIDTNVTKGFFKKIGKTFGEKLETFTEDLEKGTLDDKDIGVKISKDNVNIDLNKTKDFLQSWGQKMQDFVKEFDDMSKELDIDMNTKSN